MRLLKKACQHDVGCGPFSISHDLSWPYKCEFALVDFLMARRRPMTEWGSLVPPLPPRWIADIWGDWRQALCVWSLSYLFVNVLCVCLCEFLGLYLMCVCVCGCISSDKVVLNMFAQGPQKEKGPLTHESLEPH